MFRLMLPLVKCKECSKIKEHKVKGYCLQCYKKQYSKLYYQKTRGQFISIEKICKDCNLKIYAKNRLGVASLGYCKRCRTRRNRDASRKCQQVRRATGKIKVSVDRCSTCGITKNIFCQRMCGMCYNRATRIRNSPKEKVVCFICRIYMVQINNAHLKNHNMTVSEYQKRFPLEMLTKDPDFGPRRIIREEGMEAFRKRSSEAGRKTQKRYGTKVLAAMREGNRMWESSLSSIELAKHRSNLGNLAIKAYRKKRRLFWKGVAFHSKEEREIAKLLLNNPVEGSNTHVKIKYGTEFDFFPEGKVFVEYHPNPYNKGSKENMSNEEYKAQRIKILKVSEYSDRRVEFIFDSIKNKRDLVLKKIQDIQISYGLKETGYKFTLRSLRKPDEWVE